MKRCFPLLSLGFAIALVLTAFVRTQAAAQVPATIQPTPDADKLFAKIYPVFAHDRCANCHGKVQHLPGLIYTVTAKTHPGGEVQFDPAKPKGIDCSDCHNATEEIKAAWKFTAPDQMEWAGKRQDEICALQADQVHSFDAAAGGSEATRKGSYLNHLSTDPLITQAFQGYAGGARDSRLPALPHPPLTREVFLAGATDWVNAGAPCRTTGSITQVELFKAAYEYPSPLGPTGVVEYARREATILRQPDNTAVGYVSAFGSRYVTIRHVSDGCVSTVKASGVWGRNGPARVTDDVDVSIKVLDDGYEIHFTLPEDTMKESSSSRSDSSCGPSLVNPLEFTNTTWNPWEFVIRCPTASSGDDHMSCDPLEPKKKGTATGMLTMTIVGASDAVERKSWLNESPASVNRSDTGLPLPVKVTTRWNLKLSANRR